MQRPSLGVHIERQVKQYYNVMGKGLSDDQLLLNPDNKVLKL